MRIAAPHFNGLHPDEDERLAILIEECAEVQQIVCKILRHGYESRNPKIQNSETNRQVLAREMGDLFYILHQVVACGDVDGELVEKSASSKQDRMCPYLHHQAATPEESKAGGR